MTCVNGKTVRPIGTVVTGVTRDRAGFVRRPWVRPCGLSWRGNLPDWRSFRIVVCSFVPPMWPPHSMTVHRDKVVLPTYEPHWPDPCAGNYYGIDHAARARRGVPATEVPRCFVPAHSARATRGTASPSYRLDDLSWYTNIPVPTSLMCLDSVGDFFGGYDFKARGARARRRSSHRPGKKQWTWGNHEFGYA